MARALIFCLLLLPPLLQGRAQAAMCALDAFGHIVDVTVLHVDEDNGCDHLSSFNKAG